MSAPKLVRTGALAALVCSLAASTAVSARGAGSAVAPAESLGVYVGARDTGGVARFSGWLGREPRYALDFFSAQSWDTIARPDWWLDGWKGKGYRLVFGVPLIPDTGGSLQAGARGEYNGHFATLARTLVAHGFGDAVLRLGWEFNGGWYRWSAKDDPAAFAGYWRQVVTTMRAVAPGLRFDWNPTLGANAMWKTGLEPAYPGDEYVDIVGTDVYDQSWSVSPDQDEARWHEIRTQAYGLDWHRDFAARHGKPMSFPEWGLSERSDGHGGGDNPHFVERMHEFISSNNVAYHLYFEHDMGPHERHAMKSGAAFPAAARRFRELFGGAAPAAAAAAPAAPAGTGTPAASPPAPQAKPESGAAPAAGEPGRKPKAESRRAKNARTLPKVRGRWFWKWARWKLGRGEFRGAGASKAALRPRTAPQHVPRWAWVRLRVMTGR